MFIRICKFCSNSFETDNKQRFFCNVACQRRAYNKTPEIKEKNRLRMREYRKTHPEWKERHRILAITKHREKRAEYWKGYGKRPEVRSRINAKYRLRTKTDRRFVVIRRLRRSFRHAISRYSTTGKMARSKKYGIYWEEIIESLKPFPDNIRDFEIDHIIPLHTFNLNNPEEIKNAFSPSNLQWLTREENRRKSGKVIGHR